MEARKTLVMQGGKMAEDIRSQIRTFRNTGEKKAGVKKGERGFDEVRIIGSSRCLDG